MQLFFFFLFYESKFVLTRMFSLPSKVEETFFISSSLPALDDKSHVEPLTLKPFASHSCSLSSRSLWLLEHVYTVAPNPANSSTMAYLKYGCKMVGKKIKDIPFEPANYSCINKQTHILDKPKKY